MCFITLAPIPLGNRRSNSKNLLGTYIKKAGVRYRNPYQTRHTYASMMLSAGENSLWVAKQMGHKDTEMIIKNYGRWIPDTSTLAGYTTVNDWSSPLTGVVKK